MLLYTGISSVESDMSSRLQSLPHMSCSKKKTVWGVVSQVSSRRSQHTHLISAPTAAWWNYHDYSVLEACKIFYIACQTRLRHFPFSHKNTNKPTNQMLTVYPPKRVQHTLCLNSLYRVGSSYTPILIPHVSYPHFALPFLDRLYRPLIQWCYTVFFFVFGHSLLPYLILSSVRGLPMLRIGFSKLSYRICDNERRKEKKREPGGGGAVESQYSEPHMMNSTVPILRFMTVMWNYLQTSINRGKRDRERYCRYGPTPERIG